MSIIFQTLDQIVDSVMALPDGSRIIILSPIVSGQKGSHEILLRRLKREGFADDRVDLTVDGQAIVELPFEPTLEKGKDLYAQLGCIGCHSVDGTREGRTGPSWLGLFGSKRKLLTGETVIADEAYLKESILNPAAKVAEGAVNGEVGMPIYEGVLNEEQIQSIILYARSLGR